MFHARVYVQMNLVIDLLDGIIQVIGIVFEGELEENE